LITGPDYAFAVVYTDAGGVKFEGVIGGLYITGDNASSIFISPKSGSKYNAGGKIKIELKEAMSKEKELYLYKKDTVHGDIAATHILFYVDPDKNFTIDLPKNIPSGNYFFKMHNSYVDYLNGVDIGVSNVFTIENKKFPAVLIYGHSPTEPYIIGIENNVKWITENISDTSLYFSSNHIDKIEVLNDGEEKFMLETYLDNIAMVPHSRAFDSTTKPKNYVWMYVYDQKNNEVVHDSLPTIKSVYPFNIDMPINPDTVDAGSTVEVRATSPLPEGSDVTVSVDLKTNGTPSNEEKNYFVENLKVTGGKINTSFKIPEITNSGVATVKVTYKNITMFAKVNYNANTNRKVTILSHVLTESESSCDEPVNIKVEGFPAYDTINVLLLSGSHFYAWGGYNVADYTNVSSPIDKDGLAKIKFFPHSEFSDSYALKFVVKSADGTVYKAVDTKWGIELNAYDYEWVPSKKKYNCEIYRNVNLSANLENSKTNQIASILEGARKIIEILGSMIRE